MTFGSLSIIIRASNMSLLQKYFWLINLVSVGLGFVWLGPGLALKPYLNYILILMMVFSCLKVDLRQLKNARQEWRRYLVSLGLIYLFPVLVVYLCRSFLTEELFIGLVITASVPAAVSVVFLSDIFGGESTRALIATTVAHFLAPFFTPFLVWFFARQVIDINLFDMLWLITKLVVIPLGIAQIIRYFSWDKKLSVYVSPVNILLLALLNWGIVAPVSGLIINNWRGIAVALIVVGLVLVGEIIFGFVFGRNRSEKITWAVTDTYKNLGLASVITMNLFSPAVALGAVVYTIMTNIIIAVFQWKITFKK